MIVLDEDFAAQIEIGNGADVGVDANEEWLSAVLPLLQIGLQLDPLHEFRRRVGRIDEHIRQRHPRSVALPGGRRVAGLKPGYDVNADDKNREQQRDAGTEKNARGFHGLHSVTAGVNPPASSRTERSSGRLPLATGPVERLTHAALNCKASAPP